MPPTDAKALESHYQFQNAAPRMVPSTRYFVSRLKPSSKYLEFVLPKDHLVDASSFNNRFQIAELWGGVRSVVANHWRATESRAAEIDRNLVDQLAPDR